MKKNTISKKRNVYWIEETPKSSTAFRKLGQAKTILHGKPAAFLAHKFFQRELIKRGALAESVEADVLRFLEKVTYQKRHERLINFNLPN